MYNPVYYAFKYAVKTCSKIIAKIMAAFTFVALTVFIPVFKIAAAVYRFAAVPAALAGTTVTAYFCYTNGFSAENTYAFVGIALAVAVYFMLPVIITSLYNVKDVMKDYLMTPIFIKSPVRYTM